MANNTKDGNTAFQAAEAGLRDAEADVTTNITSGTIFSASCTNGLCTPPSTWPTPISTDISKAIDWTVSGKTRTYGSFTGAPQLSRRRLATPVRDRAPVGACPWVREAASASALQHRTPADRPIGSPCLPRERGRRPASSLQSTFLVSDP